MINIEETNLEYTLKNSQKDDWNFYIRSHQEDFTELIKLSISNKQPYSWRASWLLSSSMKDNDERLISYTKKMIDVLPALQNSQQRGLLKVLQRMVIEPKYEVKLFDTCIKIWKEINNNPALRFQALKTMFNISKKYPDFLNEIKLLTDAYYTENLTEGVKKSVFRLMKNDFN